jgi:hypothetical protein
MQMMLKKDLSKNWQEPFRGFPGETTLQPLKTCKSVNIIHSNKAASNDYYEIFLQVMHFLLTKPDVVLFGLRHDPDSSQSSIFYICQIINSKFPNPNEKPSLTSRI